ncbi:hypothetical protein GCM10027347_59820 [Larkinella harenae]
MTDAETLLRECPFCGGTPVIVTVEPHQHSIADFMPDCRGETFVECTNCSAAVVGIEDWDRRVNRAQVAAPVVSREAAQRAKHWFEMKYGNRGPASETIMILLKAAAKETT